MKEVIMDPRKVARGSFGPNESSHPTPNEDVMTKYTHLCVACALREHDFEMRAPEPEANECDVAPVVRAFIDGLPYRSVYHLDSRGIGCTDCGERVIMTYDPERVNDMWSTPREAGVPPAQEELASNTYTRR
jgi:hypothetical protein